MELSELRDSVKQIFSLAELDALPGGLLECVLTHNEQAYQAFLDAVDGDVTRDWMQALFQYYFSNRDGLKQDFTPPSLARLLSRLVGGTPNGVCVDLCAGSGALSLPWSLERPDAMLWLKEFDEGAIPFLLFNLCLRNKGGYVERCDVLGGDVFASYRIKRGERFSTCEKCDPVKLKADVCVSNPPFNLKWEPPPFASLFPCYQGLPLPPESNANYAFVLNAIEEAPRSALILPCGVMTSSGDEARIRKWLVDVNVLDAVIACPPKMFESTDIPVCILVFDQNKKDTRITLVDMREKCEQEQRDQRGQYGGASHEGRTYHKQVNVFTDEHIAMVVDAIRNRLDTPGLCASVTADDLRNADYNLSPGRHVTQEPIEHKHRPFEDIVADINRVVRQRNACKLTINETLARKLGLDVELFRQDAKLTMDDVNKTLEKLGCKPIERENYISFTKNKNELRLENGVKDIIGDVFLTAFPLWKNHVMFLNNEENRYLAELRDAFLPGLMDGSIEL